MTDWPVYHRIDGPIVMIGFGSIGRGTLPLIERHFEFDRSQLVVIDPRDDDRELLDERGVRFIQQAVTARQLPRPADAAAHRRAAARASASTSRSTPPRSTSWSSAARSARSTSTPWSSRGPGFYFDPSMEPRGALQLRPARDRAGGAAHATPAARPRCRAAAPIPAWCRGSSSRRCSTSPPTSASSATEPTDPRGLGAARHATSASRASTSPSATPSAPSTPSRSTCSSTPGRSRASSRRACSRPSSAGARTRRWMPDNARTHETGCGAAIYLLQPGANTRVRSWTPTAQAQYGFLVTHNESISIADYFTVRDEAARRVYRPTCHYAYHPCNDAVLSLHEMFGAAGKRQADWHILDETRDRRRHRRTRRAALRPRQERLLVRLAALHRGDARASRPTRTPPACR